MAVPIYSEIRAVRYIKLVGTHNTVNNIFHVVSLKAMHLANIPRLIDGVVAPYTPPSISILQFNNISQQVRKSVRSNVTLNYF